MAGWRARELRRAAWLGTVIAVLATSPAVAAVKMPPLFAGSALTTAGGPVAPVFADVTRDGRLDLVIANSGSNSVSIFAGNGDGSYQPKVDLGTLPRPGEGPNSVAVADLTGDGLLDIAATVRNGFQVAVFPALASGGFGTRIDVALPFRPMGVVAADFNGDGRSDLAVAMVDVTAANAAWVGVLVTDTSPAPATFFRPIVNQPAGASPTAIVDLAANADAAPDVVVANSTGAAVLLNAANGTGALSGGSRTLTFPAGVGSGVAVADLNGDGAPDVLVPRINSSTMGIFLNSAGANFAAATTLALGFSCLATVRAADVNGDGRPDAVGTCADRVLVYPGNGTGGFGTRIDFPIPSGVSDVALADTDGDAVLDAIAIAIASGLLYVMPGIGDGRFRTKLDFTTSSGPGIGASPQVVATGDVNRDGRLDVVSGNQSGSASVLLATPAGTFSAPRVIGTGLDVRGLALADMNGDTKLDIVTVNRTGGSVSVVLGNGDGTFGTSTNTPVGITPDSLAVGQFTSGDGNLDVAATHQNGIAVYAGSATGALTPTSTLSYPSNASPGGPHALLATDVDGDGLDDLVFALVNPVSIQVFLANGNGTFRAGASIGFSGGITQMAVGDLDADGRKELVATTNSSNLAVLPGLAASPWFGTRTDVAVALNSGPVTIGDVTGDGKADVVTTSITGVVSVFIGNGDRSLQSQTLYAVGFPGGAAIADFDGDGNGDVVVTVTNTGFVSLLRNLLYPPPTIAAAVVPAPNAAGWNNTPVTVTFACTSQHLLSCTPPRTLAADGRDQFVTGAAVDALERTAVRRVGPIHIDKVAPTLIGTPHNAPNANGWYAGDVVVDWVCSDALSGLAPGACPASSTITGEGSALSATATVSDQAGNVTSGASQSVAIDRTAPITTASGLPTWNNTAVTVSLVADDNLSGVDHTSYRLDADPTEHTGASVAIADEGVHTLTFWSTDRAGNVEAEQTVTVRIDGTSPTISHTQTPGPNANGWNNEPVLVHFICDDALSGIVSCTADVTVSSEGLGQVVDGVALDAAGNSATDPVSVSIDLTPPVAVASATTPSGTWTNEAVTVTFSCTDALSGVAECPSSITIDGEGADQVASGTAIDAADNRTTATATGIDIDRTLPSMSGTVVDAGTGVPVAPNAAGWFRTPIKVRWSCSDALAGIASDACPSDTPVVGQGFQTVAASVADRAGNVATATLDVRLDTGAPDISADVTPAANEAGWNNTPVLVTFSCTDPVSDIPLVGGCTAPVTVGEGADQSVTGTATDTAGNTASTAVRHLNVDLTAPTLIGAPRAPSATGWYRDDVVIDWTCTDPGASSSGIQAGQCPPPSLISGEGRGRTVTERVEDRAGNATTAQSTPVDIDTTVPTTVATPTPVWTNASVTVDLDATDALSGVAATFYTVGVGAGAAPGPVQTGSTVTFATAGTYELAYWSVDVAGNVEPAHTVTVRIDPTAPTITHALDPLPNAAGWNAGDVTVSFTCADDAAGVASCSAPVLVTSEGRQLPVVGTAVDNAGNQATDTALVNLDRTPPTILAEMVDTGPWSRVPVTVTFTCDDGLSGIASCPAAVTVSTDGAGQTVSGSARDNADNVASATATGISIDSVAPTITAEVHDAETGAPASPNAAGWFRRSVRVHWVCTDDRSGVALDGCSADEIVDVDGTSTLAGTATDRAGNVATLTVTVHLDRTAPSIAPTVSPPANAAGWNATPVTVSFTCDDVTSGIAVDGCPSPVALGEGAAQSATGTATDIAGNPTTATASGINVDLTAPTISGAPTTAAVNGWYRDTVVIRWTCSDGLSGIASGACPADDTIAAEGRGLVARAEVSDLASNTTAGVSAAVDIDRTPPQTAAADPVADAASVTVQLTATDNLSGVASTAWAVDGAAPTEGAVVMVTGAGTHRLTFWSVDEAGNVEAEQALDVVVNGDGTPPTITHTTTPAPNINGWNRTDVVVTFVCTAGSSPIASCTPAQTVTTEGVDQPVVGTAVDVAALRTTETASVSLDRTAPSVIADVSGTVRNGWRSQPAVVTFTCADALSGIVDGSCTSPVLVGEGAGQTVRGTAADRADNVGALVVGPLDVDLTAPTIVGTPVGPANLAGWYRGDVRIRWTCSDALSGVAVGACPADTVLTGEGAALSATASVADRAGNIGLGTVTGIRIDRTPPTVTVSTTSTATWSRTPVSVRFACSDALSGVATCPADVVLTNDGANQVVRGTASDVAGNAADARSPSVNIDRTPPSVTVTGVTAGATYVLGAASPSCKSADALSGLSTPAVLSSSGATANGVGRITATCSGAADRAGNVASATVTYSVVYAFGGFRSPLTNPPGSVTAEAHSAVPVRFTLEDVKGRPVSSLSAVRSIKVQNVTAFSQANPALATSSAAAVAGTTLSYGSGSKGFTFWWVTPSQTGKVVLWLTLDDGTSHAAYVTLSGVHRLDDDFRQHCSLFDD